MDTPYDKMLKTLSETYYDENMDETEEVIYDILGLLDQLEDLNLIDEIIKLDSFLEEKQKYIFEDINHYTKAVIIRYYLFINDIEKVKTNLEYFLTNPVKKIDYLFMVLNNIYYYGYSELVIELTKRVYNKLTKSKQLMGVEDFLDPMIYYDKLNNLYKEIIKGDNIDWDDFRKYVNNYNYFSKKDKKSDEYFEILKNNFKGSEIILNDIDYDNLDLSNLNYGFMKYMFNNKNVNFYTSYSILDDIISFLLKNKKKGNNKNLFDFSKDDLDKYIGNKVDGFFPNNQDYDIACLLLYGIPHFYEFLYEYKIISKNTFDKSTKIFEDLSLVFEETFKNGIWKYKYIQKLGDLKYTKKDYTYFCVIERGSLEDLEDLEDLNLEDLEDDKYL